MKKHVPLSCGTMQYHAEALEGDNPGETQRELYKAAGALRIVACIAGGEAGENKLNMVILIWQVNGAHFICILNSYAPPPNYDPI